MVTENLNQVRKNIQEACKAVGRDPKEVTLIAVSKTKRFLCFRKPMMQVLGYSVKIKYRRSQINIHSCRMTSSGI